MKILGWIVVFIGGLSLWILGSKGIQTTVTAKKNMFQKANTMTDVRDGATYAIVTIGLQTWMAENLRFNAPGSRLNPDNPSIIYGRLYDGITVQTVCPSGWHLPSDSEWNEMEMALGMSAADTARTFWRGEHGVKMKSVIGWGAADFGLGVDENGTNSSGFNGFPAGYYFSDVNGEEEMGGIGQSGGYWSSSKGNKVWVRFLGAPLKGVNRFENEKSSGFEVACRCVKN